MATLESEASRMNFESEAQQAIAESRPRQMIFNYHQLLLMVGIVAFALPVIVRYRSSTPLTSISASYYTEAHDIFVGFLFVIAVVFFAYNGYSKAEALISKQNRSVSCNFRCTLPDCLRHLCVRHQIVHPRCLRLYFVRIDRVLLLRPLQQVC